MDPEEPESPIVTFSELVDTLVGKLAGWLEAIVANLPNLVIALLIVIIGWFVSKWAARLVKNALDRVSDSCGWGVPFYEFKGEREQLQRYANNPRTDGRTWEQRWYEGNAESTDGLPGVTRTNEAAE